MPARLGMAGRRPRLVIAGAAVLVVVLAGGGVALAMTGSGGPHYRLATATLAPVEQEIASVGTVAATNRAVLAFPVSGTVASVGVRVGQQVSAGQLLASLSTTALQQQVVSANANLASAQQTLAADEASETTATTSSVEIASSESAVRLMSAVVLAASTAPTAPTGSARGKPTGGGSASAVGKAQQELLRAQKQLDADLAAAESALAICQADLSTSSPSSSPSSTPSGAPSSSAAGPSPTATPTGSASPPASEPGAAGCLAAIGHAPNQAKVSQDQHARDQAESSLDGAISALQAALAKAGQSTTGTGKSGTGTGTGTGKSGTGTSSRSGSSSSGQGLSGTGSAGQATTGSGSTGGSRAASGPASAQQLAADQAQIDAAQAELAVSQQDVAQARLTSPLAGTVAAVSLGAGHAVSAGSSTSTITVLGSGQESVTTTVTLADIDSVKVGDPATVRVDGIDAGLTGTVSAIGILNTTTGSSTSYPVTVLLKPTSTRLYDGSGASVQIQVAATGPVLTVPSSAVRSLGNLSTVTVLSKGKPVVTRITTGAIGTDRTRVLSGLSAGQQVVLADLSEPLPTSSN
jgi:multidrug efflux pump subunit AcrA (membrane-fusion protein)